MANRLIHSSDPRRTGLEPVPAGWTGSKPVLRQAATFLAVTVLMLLAPGIAARGAESSLVQYTPYRVQMLVAADRGPGLGPALAADLARQWSQQAEAIVGAPWRAEAERAPATLAFRMRYALDALTIDDIPRTALTFDKVMLVCLRREAGRFQVQAREFDVRTRAFGTIVAREVLSRPLLAAEVFAATVDAFAPLAEVAFVEKQTVDIRIRASALPSRDPDLEKPLKEAAVFRPVIRLNNSDGSYKKHNPIPWTYLATEKREGTILRCRIHTGLRSPLSSRRRGRMEQLAIAVRPPQTPTTITLTAGDESRRPLEGYEVHAYRPGSPKTRLLGHTTRQGKLRVPPDDVHPLVLLIVKNGGQPLAKLPVLPGFEAESTAVIRDDDQRLRVEGFITGLQERMVNVIIRQKLMVARIERRIEQGRLDEAEKLHAALLDLPTRHTFLEELDNYERGVLTADPLLKRRIDQLLGDTRKVVQLHLSTKPLDQALAKLEAAKVNAQ